jgi:hypothetical protein
MERLLLLIKSLDKIVAEICERIHLTHISPGGIDEASPTIKIIEPPSEHSPTTVFEDIVANPVFVVQNAQADSISQFGATASVGKLLWNSEDQTQTIEAAAKKLQEDFGSEIKALNASLNSLKQARNCRMALEAHLLTARSVGLLTAEPTTKPIVKPSDEVRPSDETDRAISDFESGVAVLARRAIDSNGFIQRPVETLLRSLSELIPGSEPGVHNQSRSFVPDDFIAELSLAAEIAARDFVKLLNEHTETFWNTELLPKLQSIGKTTKPPLKVALNVSEIGESIRKACDDLERRLKRGGIAAFVGPEEKRFNPIDIIKTAVRYPMQLTALFTFVVLPFLAAVGWLEGTISAAAVSKQIVKVLLPLLLVYSYYQASLLKKAETAMALDSARRHLRTEVAKSLKEIGDSISKELVSFLAKEREVLTSAFAEAERENAMSREAETRLQKAARTGHTNRVKALARLQQTLDKLIQEVHSAAEREAARLQEQFDKISQPRATDTDKRPLRPEKRSLKLESKDASVLQRAPLA